MKHGYLNLDCKLGIKDAQYCVQDSINMIEELLIIWLIIYNIIIYKYIFLVVRIVLKTFLLVIVNNFF